MATGFPLRHLRQFFGPKLVDTRPVENPTSQVGEKTLNPLLWQVAGMNLIVPRLCIVAEWNGSSFIVAAQTEAWNAKGEQAHPVLARASTGNYTYTVPSTVLDQDGESVAPGIAATRISTPKVLAAFADRVESEAWLNAGDPSIIEIRIWDQSGTPEDAPFWLEGF